MYCARCGVSVGRIDQAHRLGGRPVCATCSRALGGSRPRVAARHRGRWGLLAGGCVGLIVLVAVAVAGLRLGSMPPPVAQQSPPLPAPMPPARDNTSARAATTPARANPADPGVPATTPAALPAVPAAPIVRRPAVAARPPATSQPAPATAPATAPADGGPSLAVVDLLPLVDPKRDALEPGSWRVVNGQLVADATRRGAIEFPYRPPAEYDFAVEFTKPAGGAVAQLLAKAGTSFHWEMGDARCGFERVGGQILGHNPATLHRAVAPPGRRHTSVVLVRDGVVRAFVDGELIAERRTDYTDLSRNVDRRDESRLGLRAWNSAVVVHAARVTEVTGRGERLR